MISHRLTFHCVSFTDRFFPKSISAIHQGGFQWHAQIQRHLSPLRPQKYGAHDVSRKSDASITDLYQFINLNLQQCGDIENLLRLLQPNALLCQTC